MRLLIVTQKVDVDDSNLGFFVRWILKLSERAEVTVIATAVGVHELPARVRVLSLRKERGASRLSRLCQYRKLLREHLPHADGVFFHMCPEYVLAACGVPKKTGAKTLLWYVHKEVSLRLRLAEKLVDRIFTASRESCRLRSKKVEAVGHGIDTELFQRQTARASGLHLATVGRISPVKDLRTLVLGFLELQKRLSDATLSIIGDPITDSDHSYRDGLVRAFSGKVQFLGGVSHAELPRLYAKATAFVHASRTGSMDKAALEALAAGLPVFSSSEAFSRDIPGITKFEAGNPEDLAARVERAFESGEIVYNSKGRGWVEAHHSLHRLIPRIISSYGV